MTQVDHSLTIEERDEADSALIARVEEAVMEAVRTKPLASLSEISRRLAEVGIERIDGSVIRAAVVRLLNAGRLKLDNGHGITVA